MDIYTTRAKSFFCFNNNNNKVRRLNLTNIALTASCKCQNQKVVSHGSQENTSKRRQPLFATGSMESFAHTKLPTTCKAAALQYCLGLIHCYLDVSNREIRTLFASRYMSQGFNESWILRNYLKGISFEKEDMESSSSSSSVDLLYRVLCFSL